jgi:chromosome segregation ATPase
MKDISTRLENILYKTEKLISLQNGLKSKVSELESVNQKLTEKIKDLDDQILKLKQSNHTIASEQQKINNQKQREITHKINDLLSEVDQCISRLKPRESIDSKAK